MRHILLAEDDGRLAALVRDYLEANGFRVTVEGDGAKVCRRVQTGQPDLIILDLMLPNRDGLSICQELRQSYSGPILMLTARNEDADQILGLEFGADDYVVKPAEPRLLLARIRALLRRLDSAPSAASQSLSFGDLQVDGACRTVNLEGEAVHLSSHEFDLLWLLAHKAGEVISRDYLFQQLYNRPYDGLDRAVDVRISQLRRKLGDLSDNPQRIKTVWGRGYLFVPDAWEREVS